MPVSIVSMARCLGIFTAFQAVPVVGLPAKPAASSLQQPASVTVAEAHLADDMESLQAISSRERAARADAETREMEALSAAAKLDAEALQHQKENDIRQAQADAEVAARRNLGDSIAAKTLQTAQLTHVKEDSQSAHTSAKERAMNIASVVSGERRKAADRSLAQGEHDLVQTVTAGNENVSRWAVQSASSNVTFVNAREQALDDHQAARTNYLHASIATDSVAVSQQRLETLELRARASEERAAKLEAAAEEDRRRLREAEVAYELAVHEAEAEQVRRAKLQEELNERLGNLTVGVVSQALDNVEDAHSEVRDAKRQAEVDAQGRVSSPAPARPASVIAVAIPPEGVPADPVVLSA